LAEEVLKTTITTENGLRKKKPPKMADYERVGKTAGVPGKKALSPQQSEYEVHGISENSRGGNPRKEKQGGKRGELCRGKSRPPGRSLGAWLSKGRKSEKKRGRDGEKKNQESFSTDGWRGYENLQSSLGRLFEKKENALWGKKREERSATGKAIYCFSP